MALTDSQSQRFARQLQQRLDPHGSEETQVVMVNNTALKISLPADISADGLNRCKRRICQAGYLEFLIIASHHAHQQFIAAAVQSTDPKTDTVSPSQPDGTKAFIGKWASIGRSPANEIGLRAYKYVPLHDVVRDSVSGQRLSFDDFETNTKNPGLALAQYLKSREIEDIQVLLLTGDNCRLTGDMISSATSLASAGHSTLDIHFTSEGATELTKLTAQFKPDAQQVNFFKMAVVLDDHILTAPRILEEIRGNRVMISGSFNEAEVEEIAAILRSGSHPQDLTLHFREQRLVPASQR